jgi:hypothetical protein
LYFSVSILGVASELAADCTDQYAPVILPEGQRLGMNGGAWLRLEAELTAAAAVRTPSLPSIGRSKTPLQLRRNEDR